MWSEFKEFLVKANVLTLALAFIIGVALASVVTSLVNDIIMPPVGLLLGGVDFQNMFIDLSGKHYTALKEAKDAGAAVIAYGSFINTIITFVVVSFVVFLLARSLVKTKVTTKACPSCAMDIPLAAVRCPHCTTDLGVRTAG
ncbi:MAG TPA: large conductance mechanosensitive channel protein MscL [Candidatus Limnocylindria bacterium]|jgi:large conductance mechanosensitive channel